MLADLHCHSVYSDGYNSVKELADFATRAGLTHLALSDHDTMAGVQPLQQAAGDRGLNVIPALECTCVDAISGRPVHILCYAPTRPALLDEVLHITLERRRIAKLAMAERIAKLYPLTIEDVLRASAQSASIYEVHLIAPLAAMGYTKTVTGSLLQELIGPKGSCFVPIRYPDVREILHLIHEAGGLAVLAHPGQFESLNLAKDCARNKQIQGIECYHPRNCAAVTAQCLEICREHGLLVTGGTDFHGMYASMPHPLGTCTLTGEAMQRFLDAIALL